MEFSFVCVQGSQPSIVARQFLCTLFEHMEVFACMALPVYEIKWNALGWLHVVSALLFLCTLFVHMEVIACMALPARVWD